MAKHRELNLGPRGKLKRSGHEFYGTVTWDGEQTPLVVQLEDTTPENALTVVEEVLSRTSQWSTLLIEFINSQIQAGRLHVYLSKDEHESFLASLKLREIVLSVSMNTKDTGLDFMFRGQHKVFSVDPRLTERTLTARATVSDGFYSLDMEGGD